MIRKQEELRKEIKSEMRGGKGAVELIHILEKEEMGGKGRLYAKNILPPGTSIGFHPHQEEFEVYYILKGEGIYNDNGAAIKVKPGDMLYNKSGESHSIENTGSEDLELIALILFD